MCIYTPNSKKVVFGIVALCIAYCCIPKPQSTMDVHNEFLNSIAGTYYETATFMY